MSLSVSRYSNGEDLIEDVLNRPIDEIVNYINSQQIVTYLLTDLNVTVGNSGADFTTLQDAINFMCRFVPAKEDVTGLITIKSGFVIESPTRMINLNLGWCRIESEDPTVFMDPALAYTKPFSSAPFGDGIFLRRTTAPVFAISIRTTSMATGNHRIIDASFGSNIGFSNGNTIEGSTGSGSSGIDCNTGSFVFVNGSTVNKMRCTEGGKISIVGGSFSSLEMQLGGVAYIEGSTGSKTMNIPVNTLTRQGIIYSE